MPRKKTTRSKGTGNNTVPPPGSTLSEVLGRRLRGSRRARPHTTTPSVGDTRDKGVATEDDTTDATGGFRSRRGKKIGGVTVREAPYKSGQKAKVAGKGKST